jgi:IS5 family transposase
MFYHRWLTLSCRPLAGRKPFDIIWMFKILVIQSLYNLSDDQLEFHIRDRLSFMRFLGLLLGDTVPDAKAPEDWKPNKCHQKDVDARWTKKNGKTYYGYKNHISIDVKHKLIRDYDITAASVRDRQVFEDLLDSQNNSRGVWADSAYRSEESLDYLSGEAAEKRQVFPESTSIVA